MARPTKYDAVYAEGPDALGAPYKEILAHFTTLKPPLDVLDLGAGQGRDAIPIAQMGFYVTAVDNSTVGLGDLDAKARALGLPITTINADLTEYSPSKGFDVLLADRTFHMLALEERQACLARCLAVANPRAHAIVVDERSNLPGIKSVFEQDRVPWHITYENKGFLFLQRSQ